MIPIKPENFYFMTMFMSSAMIVAAAINGKVSNVGEL